MDALDHKLKDQSAAEITGDIQIKPIPTLKKLGLPDLKHIETEIKPDADKVQTGKEKVTQYMKEIKDKVNSYLSRAELGILSKDPEISNMQIEKSEKQLYKIAQFVWSKIAKDNENEEKKSSEITYVEMIEQVQSILQQAINEGQEKKKNLLKNSLQCKDSSSIQTKKNEIIKTINNLEEECYLNRDILFQDESDIQEVNIKNTENCSQIINEFSRGLRSEIRKIKDEIKSCNAFRDSNLNPHNFKKTQEKIDENIHKCYDNFDHITSLLNEQGTYLANTKEEDKNDIHPHQHIRSRRVKSGRSANSLNRKQGKPDIYKTQNKNIIINARRNTLWPENKDRDSDSDEQLEIMVDLKQNHEQFDILNEIVSLDNCDKLDEMIKQWKFLNLVFKSIPQKESSFNILNKVLADAVMKPSETKEEDLKTYQDVLYLLDILAGKLKSDILITRSYKVDVHLKNQLEIVNNCAEKLKKKVKEVKFWSHLNPIKINEDNADVSMEEESKELNKEASDILQNINNNVENQLSILRNSILDELENLKALAAILNLMNEQHEIDTHMKSKHKIDCNSLSQLIFKIKDKVNKEKQNIVTEIKDNNYQMYTQNSSNSNSANLINNNPNACNSRFYSIYTKFDELKNTFKNVTDQYNELTTSYKKALSTSKKDSDKLEASLNNSKKSLVQFQDQINIHKNGLLGDAAKSVFEQQKKKELIKQVEELIEAVKEHNTNIKEYNQNLDSDNLKLKKEITKIEKGYIFNKKSFNFVNKLLTKLREKQVEINKIRKKNNKIVNQLKDIDKFRSEYKGCNIIIRKNDLTEEIVDVIVNPANERLEHTGGAPYEILCAGGDIINEESRKYIRENGKLLTSCAMITSAGYLPCKAVIHVVGPRFIETAIDHTFEEILMDKTITSILELVIENDFKSVSIPAISTGIFKFPLARFAVTCTETIKKFVDDHKQEMKNRKIILCNFDDDTTNRLLEIVPQVLQNEEENENKNSSKKKVKSDNDESEDSDNEVKRCKDCRKKIKDRSHQKKGHNLKVCINCFQNKSDDISKTKKLKDKAKSDDEEEKIPKSRRNKRSNQDSDQSDSDDSENLEQNKKMKESKYKTMKKQHRNSDSEGSDEGMKESKKDKKKTRNSDNLIEKKNKKKDKKDKKHRNDSDE